MRARLSLFPLLFTVSLMAAGCAQAGKPLQLAQLIVKFRPATVACDAAGIADLARQTRLDLQWIRPMSGQACVLRWQGNDPAQALATLQARPEVEWAETDAVMRPNAP
jgi:hypothetical protein